MKNRNAILILLLIVLPSCQTMKPAEDKDTARAKASTQTYGKLAGVIQHGLQKNPPRTNHLVTKSGPVKPEPPAGQCEEKEYKLKELSLRELSISNQELVHVSRLLNVIGYKTIAITNETPPDSVTVSCADLPIIVIPGEGDDAKNTFKTGEGTDGTAKTTGNLKIDSLRKANSGDADRMLVFYHPADPKSFERLKSLVQQKIDIASPQVYIETMVLEINEEDSRELGIKYETANIGRNSLFSIGLLDIKSGPTVDYRRNTRTDSSGAFVFTPGSGVDYRIKALVETGRAQILSRPSILALSNRQAMIQIADIFQTPKITQSLSETGRVTISGIEFEPLVLGITLNLRPRVSADRKWVSLELDATVETENEENDGQAFGPDPTGGRILLAEKRGSSARKVRTFARIPDRTPIIIGGLVAGKKEKQRAKVPGLGNLPVIGSLFGVKDDEVNKREVVIVLTPFVLAEDAIGVKSNMPNDSVLREGANTKFFNNHYSLKTSDLFNLGFLYADRHFMEYRMKAEHLARTRPSLLKNKSVNSFLGANIPGDRVIVSKIFSDILSRDGSKNNLDSRSVYIRRINQDGILKVTSLHDLTKELKEVSGESDRYLQISFKRDSASSSWLPDYRLVGKAQEKSAAGESGNEISITIRSPEDLARLMNALLVNEMLSLNGGFPRLRVNHLREGQLLRVPATGDRANYVISENTLRIYKDTQSHFQNFINAIAQAYREIDAAELQVASR